MPAGGGSRLKAITIVFEKMKNSPANSAEPPVARNVVASRSVLIGAV